MAGTRNAPTGAGARLRRALPLLVLLLALGVTGVGAFRAQRAHRSHRETAEALLRDYGAFAAWSFAARAAGFLDNSFRSTLYPLRPELLSGDPARLEGFLAAGRRRTDACGCGTPLAGRFAFHARLAPGRSTLTFAGEPPAPAQRTALRTAVERHAREEHGQGYRLMQVPESGDATLLVAYVLHGDRGDSAVYGVEVDGARFREELRRALDHPDLLPHSLTRGAPNTSLLAVRLLGAGGEELFASTERGTPAIFADQALPERMAGAVVRAAVLPEAAEGLIIGGMPENRAPAALLLFGLAAGLMVLSVSLLRKENDLARLRSDFVANVSHELRTPVAQIRLFIETLRLGRVNGEAQRDWALERIERETLRLAGLLDKILHFHRTNRGAVPADRMPVDVGMEVGDAAASFEALLRPGKARLVLELAEGLRATAHADSLRQVVLNLLENAVKYGADGQTIRLRAEWREGWARISVEDEGRGVPPRERKLIWEPFRRGAAAVGSVTAGGGIGLSLVREIVRAHGGRAWVGDAPGGGACFVVELPALPSGCQEPGTGRAAATTEPREAHAGAA